MGEEIRRSGRATKGQHTKINESPEAPKEKRGKGGRGKAVKTSKEPTPEEDDEEEEDGEAIIRCVCGYVVEDKDDDRPMVMCDNCSAWEHNECVGISDDPDELPEQYFCEQCKPEDHKELLAAMARGEKPWTERAAQREREEAEKKARKKRGKKGGRLSRANEKADENDESGVQSDAPTPSASAAETGRKRKAPAEPTQEISGGEQGSSKIRKVSTTKDTKLPPRRQSTIVSTSGRKDSKDNSLQTELVEDISQLRSDVRQRAARALVKLFVDSTKDAQKSGGYKLPSGQTFEAFGLRLGLAVEYALYMNFWGLGEPKPEYGSQMRAILHNVKANPDLRDGLLNQKLSPNDLSNMSSFDMASKELKAKTEEMMKEAEKQTILVQDDGPRIRRTHKGEELVEETIREADIPSYSTAPMPRRRESEVGQIARGQSPDAMSPGSSHHVVELPEDIGKPKASRPLTVDTKVRPRQAPDRKSSTFDIQNVWSSVDSPDNDKSRVRGTPRQASSASQGGVKDDPEIDSLLRDDEDEEEEYSPVDVPSSPSTIWRGIIQMPQVAEFRATARHIVGADLSHTHPWTLMIPSLVSIEGRIDIVKANDYLCGLRYSNTTDVTVVAVSPLDNPTDQASFNKLYDYFSSRQRYGVVSRSPVAAVRDIYAIPLDAGSAKPEFLELLEECTLEDPRPQRLLLLAYTIKTPVNQGSAQATPSHATAAGAMASPGTAHGATTQYATYPQSHQTPSVRGGQTSPLTPGYNHTPPQQNSYQPPPQPQRNQLSTGYPGYSQSPHPAQQHPSMLKDHEAALAVLGPELAHTPSVQQLLQISSGIGVAQFEAVRAVFMEQPLARERFDVLMGGLEGKAKMGQGQ